jgi:hypothetical protein
VAFLGSFLGFDVLVTVAFRGKGGGAWGRARRGVPCTWRENRTVRVLDEPSNAGASRASVWCVGETGADAGDASVSGDRESSTRSDRWSTRLVVSHDDGAARVSGGLAATAASAAGAGEDGDRVLFSSVSTVDGGEGCEAPGAGEGVRPDARP